MKCFSGSCYIHQFYLAVLHAVSHVLTNQCCLYFCLHLDFPGCTSVFQVMHICALLLCCLAGIIQGVYGMEPRQLMAKSLPGSIYQAGDVVIGGLFPVHVKAPQSGFGLRSKKVFIFYEM